MKIKQIVVKQFNNHELSSFKPKEAEGKKEPVVNYEYSKETAEALKAYAVSSNEINFGYHHPLKTLFLKGKLPWLKYGMYGDLLTPKNVTLEHIEPVSSFKERFNGNREKAKRVATTWDNIALASKRNNNGRGSEPLSDNMNWEALGIYLDQFKGRYIPGFGRGEEYIKGIINRVNSLIKEGK